MKNALLLAALIGGLCLGAGCGDSAKPVEVTNVRVKPAPEKAAVPASADPSNPHAGMDMGAMGAMGGMGAPAQSALKLEWDSPAEWEAKPATSMRVANFIVKDHPDTQCYAAVLAGAAGGKEANINRWRNEQMGQPALSTQEIEALPTLDVLGQKAPWVEVAGNFSGMSGESAKSAILYGAVCELGAQTVFIKMTGPQEVMQGQKDIFLKFCASLRMPK